jgi:CAAX protease family protein
MVNSSNEPTSLGRDRTNLRRIWTLCGLLLICGWPFLPMGQSSSLADVHNDLLVILIEWIVTVLLAFIVFFLLKRAPGFFGLRVFRLRDLLAMFALFVATYLVMGVVTQFVSPQTSMLDLQRIAAVPFSMRLGLVFTAGICEEFMYRGFALEELADWTGSVRFGAFLSWLVFVAAHLGRYGFTSGLLIPAIAGGALTLFYLWRRNLPACMFMHALFDGVTIFLLPALLRAHGR